MVGKKVPTVLLATNVQSFLVCLWVKQLQLNCVLSLRQHFHHYCALQMVSTINTNCSEGTATNLVECFGFFLVVC